MRWPTLAAVTLITVAVSGCDRIPGLGGGEEETPATDTVAATTTAQVQDSVATPAEPEETQAMPETAEPEPPPPAQVQRPVSSGVDEPWTPTHTGTVDPGMTREEVLSVWGNPVTERSMGNWTYLYYRNGCEVTCGTYDVVLFQDGVVTDAIVRGPGHAYGGESSSPPNNQAQFTPPGG